MTHIPSTMKAIVLTGHGGLEKLEYHEDWPTPHPGPGEVLVKVHACGMNNTDINTRSGWYSKAVTEATTGGEYDTVNEDDPTWGGAALTFPRIQGADMVGTVVAVGEGVDEGLIGKRVMNDGWIRVWDDPTAKVGVGYFGSERDGGFAEYTTINQQQILPVESDLSDAELATFSCSYTTAENLLNRVQCGSDDTVLITGASGGVGGALIQLAKRRGAKTVALASEAKHAQVAVLEPTAILPRAPENLGAALEEATGSSEVTIVADIAGGDYFSHLIEVLARGGRYGTSGAIAGPIVDLDLRTLYLNDLTFHGCTVTSLNVFPDLVSYIERGEIKPMLSATYPLEDFHAGQQAFIDKKHTGNIVVTME
ncbi:MAG: alcohol dehydrogenase family protein [Rhizobiaceae bacterium]|nr:alcohol dehydrogenase family protein [Rhizobiaceae bacterium]